MEWVEVKIRLLPEFVEKVSEKLFEMKTAGIVEKQISDEVELTAYFHKREKARVQRSLATHLKKLKIKSRIELGKVEEEDWTKNYKKTFFAQKLSSLFFLVPLWDKKSVVPHGFYPIRLEPGQAFGTGLHATTRLCLIFMERWFQAHSNPASVSVLDVGTGSGILAIAGSKLGAGRVVAVDNDPLAVEAAKENAATNEQEIVQVSGKDVLEISEGFDLVVANILLETHLELAPVYAKLVKSTGALILSGLLGGQEKQTAERLESLGFLTESSSHMQEWVAMQFYRRQG